MERLVVDMVIRTKDILEEYDLDKELEKLDDEYCLPYAFYLDYEWRRYLVKRKKILREIKDVLSEDALRYS